MKVTFLLTFLVLVVLVTNSFGWLWRRSRRNRCGTWLRHRPCTASKCSDPSRGKPFYFGTTRLFCMAKGKRGSSPSRPTWALKHRWIEYNGHFFERLKNGGDIFSSDAPKDSNKCSSRRESRPAGYSSLSIDCMKRCTNKYRQRYGSYRLLSNNCHHFANRFSDILCSSSTCPSWCA
ncbi:uncharacterized protein LOC134692912 [Mytilus trossulus]|uniref:uncharacterized protein LOC134692912 n=1 Tax=Mytilus trossulus TaxID=6551 RepID=UPI003004CF0C